MATVASISWSEIEAECDGYRQGFVAIFRKYEGQPTDEVDKYGRTVEVTAASFARHAGIPETTFKRWVQAEMGTKRVVNPDDRKRLTRATVLGAIRQDPQAVSEVIADALEDPAISAEVEHQRVSKYGASHAVGSRLKKAQVALSEALTGLAGSELPEHMRSDIRYEVKQIREQLDALDALLNGGASDEALARLLDGELS